jgi:hypothetical protein
VSSRKLKITGNVLFRETQHFRVKWLWMIIICSVLVSIGVTAATAFADKANKTDVAIALAFIIPLETGMLYLFYIVKLETVVTMEAVFYRWQPFFKKYSSLEKQEIEQAKPDKGPPLRYGFHIVPGYGRVNNTGPGKGIRFILSGGKKIFIGTQKLNAFQSAVEELLKFSSAKMKTGG